VNAVERALERAQQLGEQGVQVAVMSGEELLVDAWVGDLDVGGPAVDGTTLFPVFSVTKAFTATAVHVQAERGLVDYETPIAEYWPEYGTAGKERVTVRDVLTHRAGVPQMPPDITPERLGDWDWVVARLAEVAPAFDPGTTGYLPFSFGWLLGEVVRRTDPHHRSLAEFVTTEVSQPLGLGALRLGLAPDDPTPVATLTYPNRPPSAPQDSVAAQAVPAAVGITPEVFNSDAVQHSWNPSAGVIANARSMARFFAMLAGGGELAGTRLLSSQRVESFLEPRPGDADPDRTYGIHFSVGMGGYWLADPPLLVADGRRILCHPGAGGSIGWADLDRGVGVAICHNRMFHATGEHPFSELRSVIDELT
jgi:CubicO group peptidase (beta-lactamase class C family)